MDCEAAHDLVVFFHGLNSTTKGICRRLARLFSEIGYYP